MTTTASPHQQDAGIADGPALVLWTNNEAWRGDGAVEPLWDDLDMPPPAVLPPHREPAFSLLVDTELRT